MTDNGGANIAAFTVNVASAGAIDLTSVLTTGAGYTVVSTGTSAVTGSDDADTLTNTSGSATMIGLAGIDTFTATADTLTISDLGVGGINDIVTVASGATAAATVTGNWAASSGTQNLGGAASNFTIAVGSTLTVDLTSATVTSAATDGFSIASTSTGTMTGSAGADTITTSAASTINGLAGDDTITGSSTDIDHIFVGGTGADTIVSGSAADTDVFTIAGGDSDFTTGIDLYADAVFNDATNDTFLITGLTGTETIQISQATGIASTALTVTTLNGLINSNDGSITNKLNGGDTATDAMILTTTDSKTYLVFDVDANGVFADGTDIIVEITGSTLTSMSDTIYA